MKKIFFACITVATALCSCATPDSTKTPKRRDSVVTIPADSAKFLPNNTRQ